MWWYCISKRIEELAGKRDKASTYCEERLAITAHFWISTNETLALCRCKYTATLVYFNMVVLTIPYRARSRIKKGRPLVMAPLAMNAIELF